MSDAPLTPEQMKAARELLGWSQMDVANRVGLTEWVIGFFERGERLIRARYLRRVRSMFEAAGVIFRRGERRGAWREAPQGCEMSINPNRSTANIKLFELCEPPQREVKHSAKTPKSEIRRTAMFTKISRPTVEGAAK